MASWILIPLAKKLPVFVELEGKLPISSEPCIGPYPDVV
jgi:hypothetical protein